MRLYGWDEMRLEVCSVGFKEKILKQRMRLISFLLPVEGELQRRERDRQL